jgi:hypothetical protein
MTNSFEQQPPDPSTGPVNEKLLEDIRSLPKVSAPLDFRHHLARRIEAEQAALTLPWWKRFFLPLREGGRPIPAFAYGAAATVIVLAASLYVYEATYVEKTFKQEQRAPVEILDDASKQEFLHQSTVPDEEGRVPAQAPENGQPMPGESHTPPTTPAAPAAPAVLGRDAVAEEEDVPESFDLQLRMRGAFEPEDLVADTSKADSLRRLDSLRQLQQQAQPPDRADPR